MIERRGMPTRVQDYQFSAAAGIETEQLTARFNDAVAVCGNQLVGAAAADMEMAPGADLEELIARLVDVTVCDGPAQGEAACVVRVRLPDGHVFGKVFGAARPVAALFRYCGSAVAACGMAGRPFRLVRFAGGASEEIPPRGDVSLQDLRLNRCIIYVVFSPDLSRLATEDHGGVDEEMLIRWQWKHEGLLTEADMNFHLLSR